MSLEESINRLVSVLEARIPLLSVAEESEPAKPTRRGATPKVVSGGSVPPAPPPKYEDVREAILAVAERKGMPAAVEILAKFEVTHAKSLKPEQYAEALAMCQKA